jgi:modification methylase
MTMKTKHKLIFGNCMDMTEIGDENIHLIFTSPRYFNAPFDYDGLFANYDQY